MPINQDNYEQFFLDHAEGNLSPEMEKELTDFLEANPDLKAVLDDFDPSPLQTVEIHNGKLKVRLKKHLFLTEHISEENVDEWMLRDIEGLLDESEENELEEFLSLNPAYRYDYKLFGYTILSPDLSISYMGKKELKKKLSPLPVKRLVWLVPAAAALLLIFIGIRYFSQTETQSEHPAAPPIAVIPSISSSGTVSDRKISPVAENKLLKNETPTQDHLIEIVRSNTSRIKPISAKEIILINPTFKSSLNLADCHFYPNVTAERKDRSLVAMVFASMVAQVREDIGHSPMLEKVHKADFSFWSIAKAGINGFNNMSDRDLKLYVRKDEEGKVKSYALLEEERLILSKELNKN